MIENGDLTEKTGWVCISLHPTMTDEEVRYIGQAVVNVIKNYKEWQNDYVFNPESGEFTLKNAEPEYQKLLDEFTPL